MKLEVTKTEYIVQNNKPVIHLFCRDKDGNRVIIKSDDKQSYFYANSGSMLPNTSGVVKIEGGFPLYNGKILDKITTRLPADVGRLRDTVKGSHEKSILFPDRWKVDVGVKRYIEIPDNLDLSLPISSKLIKPIDYTEAVLRRLYVDLEINNYNKIKKVQDYIKDGFKEIDYYECKKCGHKEVVREDIDSHIDVFHKKEKGLVKIKVKEVYDFPIICASLIDSFTGNRVVFQLVKDLDVPRKAFKVSEKEFYIDGITQRELSDEKNIILIQIKAQKNKPDEPLVRELIQFIIKFDPDIILGYNSKEFDIPKIINRSEFLGVNYKGISPLGIVNEGTIYGREQLDIYRAIRDLIRKELKRQTLDFVAKEYLGFTKIDIRNFISDELKKKIGEGSHQDIIGKIYELGNKQDLRLLANYNLEDSILCQLLDEKKNLTKTRIACSNIYGTHFDSTFNTTQFGYLFSLRFSKDVCVAPNILNETEKVSFGGWGTLDPFSGRLKNVIVLDYKATYPTIRGMFNIWIDTKSNKGNIVVGDVDYVANRINTKVLEGAKNIRYFKDKDTGEELVAYTKTMRFLDKTQKISYIDKAQEYLTKEREIRQRKLKELDSNTDEHTTLALEDNQIKELSNQLNYGFLDWIDGECAGCLPNIAYWLLVESKNIIEKFTPYRIVYGDTDSLFIYLGEDKTIEECKVIGKKLVDTLNKAIRIYTHNRWKISKDECDKFSIKFEKMGTFAQYGNRKQYAMLLDWHKDWKEGEDISKISDKKKYLFKGYKNVRSDYADIVSDTLTEIWKKILNLKDSEVKDCVKQKLLSIDKTILEGKDLEKISTPMRLKKEINEYKGGSINNVKIRSVINASKLGIIVSVGSRVYMLPIKRVSTNNEGVYIDEGFKNNGISFNSTEEISNFVKNYCEIDKEKIVTQIKDAIVPVISLIGLEWNDIILGGKQKKIGEY